ncbi:MAG: hypothetical protein WBX25_36775 [Rhodomicrobium sp.]
MNNVRSICVAAASIVLCFGWTAFAATEKSGDNPAVMFVQSSSGASFKDGKLTLVSPSTVFFSERPERLAGHMPSGNFIKAWPLGEDSLKKDPPNAVLAVFDAKQQPAKMVVTLQNPRLEGSNIVYDANIIKGSVPEGIHEAALFIDDSRIVSGPYHENLLPNGTLTGPIAPEANP